MNQDRQRGNGIWAREKIADLGSREVGLEFHLGQGLLAQVWGQEAGEATNPEPHKRGTIEMSIQAEPVRGEYLDNQIGL